MLSAKTVAQNPSGSVSPPLSLAHGWVAEDVVARLSPQPTASRLIAASKASSPISRRGNIVQNVVMWPPREWKRAAHWERLEGLAMRSPAAVAHVRARAPLTRLLPRIRRTLRAPHGTRG